MGNKANYKVYEANLEEFKPDPKNHNKHTLKGHKLVTNSMQKRGYARPAFAAKDGTVLGGNLSTMEIAPSLGIGEGKVIVVETDGTVPIIHKRVDVAPDSLEARQLSYEDNFAGILSFELDPQVVMADIESGFDFEAIDVSLEELGEMLEGGVTELLGGNGNPKDVEPQIDKADQLRQKYGVELGQVWQLGEHRIVCGDCTDPAVVKSVMRGERAQVVFTDPPFATFGSSTGKMESQDFGMIKPFFDIVSRITQENLDSGRCAFVCCDWRSYPALFEQASRHLSPKNLIVWYHGAIKMGTANFRPCYELILYAQNRKFGGNWSDKVKGWKIENRGLTDVWEIRQKESAPGTNRIHSSQKPVELVEFALTHTSDGGEIVSDWFIGSGTTLIACENLGRKCRGIEIDPGYLAVTLERWHNLTTRDPIRLSE